MLTGYKTLFFDFDGTIHESIKIYYPAFMKGYEYLVTKGHAEPRHFTLEEVSQWLGYNSRDMWQSFMPELPDDVRLAVSQIVGTEMRRLLDNGEGSLYDGVENTLAALRDDGYTLVFLSNCSPAYMASGTRAFGLDRYFHHFYCSGMFDQITKAEVLKHIMPQFEGPMAIIGDRIHDMEAGRANHITTIGCLYGYGKAEEFEHADHLISSIRKLG